MYHQKRAHTSLLIWFNTIFISNCVPQTSVCVCVCNVINFFITVWKDTIWNCAVDNKDLSVSFIKLAACQSVYANFDLKRQSNIDRPFLFGRDVNECPTNMIEMSRHQKTPGKINCATTLVPTPTNELRNILMAGHQ